MAGMTAGQVQALYDAVRRMQEEPRFIDGERARGREDALREVLALLDEYRGGEEVEYVYRAWSPTTDPLIPGPARSLREARSDVYLGNGQFFNRGAARDWRLQRAELGPWDDVADE